MVCATVTSCRLSTSTLWGSSSSTARSAYFPLDRLPSTSSLCEAYALPYVYAESASSIVRRSFSPRMKPLAVFLLTMPSIEVIGASGAHGASVEPGMIAPLRTNEPIRYTCLARSSPSSGRYPSPLFLMKLPCGFGTIPSRMIRSTVDSLHSPQCSRRWRMSFLG